MAVWQYGPHEEERSRDVQDNPPTAGRPDQGSQDSGNRQEHNTSGCSHRGASPAPEERRQEMKGIYQRGDYLWIRYYRHGKQQREVARHVRTDEKILASAEKAHHEAG